jgi:RHS repeat-associated protein
LLNTSLTSFKSKFLTIEPLTKSDKRSQRLIGKEKDIESSLGDFGVRKYDEEIGRFISPDPLWEKYYGLTPNNYCGNNTVNTVFEPSGGYS